MRHLPHERHVQVYADCVSPASLVCCPSGYPAIFDFFGRLQLWLFGFLGLGTLNPGRLLCRNNGSHAEEACVADHHSLTKCDVPNLGRRAMRALTIIIALPLHKAALLRAMRGLRIRYVILSCDRFGGVRVTVGHEPVSTYWGGGLWI